MHLLNFVSPYVLACYMFAMECFSPPDATSLHNIGGFFQDLSSPYVKKIKLLFRLHVTTEKNMEKFSPHYQMIPLYPPAIRKVLPLIISYPQKLLLWPRSDRDWLLKLCVGPECGPWLDIQLTRALKCEIKVSKYSFMFWHHLSRLGEQVDCSLWTDGGQTFTFWFNKWIVIFVEGAFI